MALWTPGQRGKAELVPHYPPVHEPYAQEGDAYANSSDPQDWEGLYEQHVVVRYVWGKGWPWRPHTTKPVLWVDDIRDDEEIMTSWERDPKTLKGTKKVGE